MASDLVTADCVSAQEFPDLARRFHVSAVPKTVVNDAEDLIGAQPEAALLAAILRAGSAPSAP